MSSSGHYLNEFLMIHEITHTEFFEMTMSEVPLSSLNLRGVVKNGLSTMPIKGFSATSLARGLEKVVYDIDEDGYMWEGHRFDYRRIFRQKKEVEGRGIMELDGGYLELIKESEGYSLSEAYQKANKTDRGVYNHIISIRKDCIKIFNEHKESGVPLLSLDPILHVDRYCRVYPYDFDARLAYYLSCIIPVELDYRFLMQKTKIKICEEK